MTVVCTVPEGQEAVTTYVLNKLRRIIREELNDVTGFNPAIDVKITDA
jgi:hypothetical protein